MIEITGYVTATGRDSKVINGGGKRFIEQIYTPNTDKISVMGTENTEKISENEL